MLELSEGDRSGRGGRSGPQRRQFREEGAPLADHTPYQKKIIDRYYKNLDAIKFQRLSELATDLFVADNLRKLEFPEPRIGYLLEKRDPTVLVEILKELERKG
jgi:hypothetical protein